MRLSYEATILLDMHDPQRYGYSEPTMKSLLEMIKRDECTIDMPEMFYKPLYLFTQKKDLEAK